MGAKLFNQDIFVNVAGGVQVEELGVDLAIIAAIASSYEEKPLDSKTVIFGEVDLAGEVRGIAQAEARVKEAGKPEFNRCILPTSNSKPLSHLTSPEMIGVASLAECWRIFFND